MFLGQLADTDLGETLQQIDGLCHTAPEPEQRESEVYDG